MKDAKKTPEGLIDDAKKGLFEGDWYYEEDAGGVRLGMRVSEKLHEEQSPFQKIAVYQTPFFGRLLTLDGMVMLTERDEFVYHEMVTHLPLCGLLAPRRVLILGGGDCGCLREVLRHPNIEQVVQCDIDQRVTEVCERYFDWVTPARSDPRAQVLFDDGVAYIEHQRASFNLIIVDSTDPIGPGIGLFLHDFYDKVARALAPGGVMVAQTESPHWSAPMVGAIYSELKQSFAQVAPYCGAVPTYPSGFWTWAWASNDTRPDAHFDAQRARQLEPGCSYYNADIHRAAFALPTFARQAVAGHNPFSRFQNAPEE